MASRRRGTMNKCVFHNAMADTRKTCSEVKGTISFWMAVWQGRKRYCFQDIILHWDEIIMGTFRR
ncbi:hypothetical protein FRX31_032741 [Thalictrum thalictroides]|uniref:Uncharacterized protein n=1 Tax=Thalictrum thalictroides TaxID=46969 RepID=A0A7J6UZ08_THATH|nr:hypothetical protein FRX31_032741 [Thalictrum thalictroides]